ncbi:hypothetical protein [uncultured Chryseobacterium sp.]|uniref:hypothetical protein n=1 Tax=uncultured Chryseobacterium sp. TaxID=259322 RepID=UPI0025D0657F|nr:hypothetical protein [uncultured Chryseobacterium sp.]
MKIKYFEYIAIYLSVLLVCILIGILGRLNLIEKGADEYTANVFLWACIGFGILMFAILSLFIDIVYQWVVKFFLNKEDYKLHKIQITAESEQKIRIEKENSTADIHPLEIAMQITEDDNNTIQGNKPNNGENTSILESNNQILKVNTQIKNVISEDVEVFQFSDIEKIRVRVKSKNEEIIHEKLNFLIKYTQEKFAPYTSDEEIDRFCIYLINFLREGKYDNVIPIKVDTLKTIDLMHFAWNFWNHYKGRNERKNVAMFLKTVFPHTFKDTELPTIEKLLSSRPNEGIIKIKKNLLQ